MANITIDRISAAFFAVLGLAVFAMLSYTLNKAPLFEWKFDDLNWNNAWLIMTVIDYYGSTFCLCGVALYNVRASLL